MKKEEELLDRVPESSSWIFQKHKVYLWYECCLNLFGKIRRKANFNNSVAEILRKSMREEREMMWWEREKKLNFSDVVNEIPTQNVEDCSK